MDTTFAPTVSLESSVLVLPIPPPGYITVSFICMVVLTRLMSLAARESTATITSGFAISAVFLIISAVSRPVVPVTPGAMPLTHAISSSPSAS